MKKNVVALIIGVTLLSGCYPSGESKPTEISNQTDSTSPIYDTSTLPVPEGLTLEFEAPSIAPSSLTSVRLTLKKWDKDEVKKLLIDGKEIIDQFERDCQFFPNEKMFYYDTGDMNVVSEPGRIEIDDVDALGGEFKYGSVYFNGIDNCVASGEELSAFSRKDAVGRANALLDKLGIANYGEPLITPIKADYANSVLAKRKGSTDKEGNEFSYTPWTEQEEIYVLNYPQIFENTELAVHSFLIPQSNDKYTEPPRITVVVNKDKIICLSARSIYSSEYQSVDDIAINFNFDAALEKLKEYYSNLVLEQTAVYYSGKLVYIPREMTDDEMTVTFVPGWEFLGYSELWEAPSPFNRYQESQYFYADTGFRYIES